MANDTRQPKNNIDGNTVQKIDAELAKVTSFFELLKRVESSGKRFGRTGGLAREPARLGQGVRLSFATRDIEAIEWDEKTGQLIINVFVLGLLGPEGPMPLHLTRWVMNRLSNRWFSGNDEGASSDTAFLNFCNLLQHRMITLFWRAWGDTQMEVQFSRDDGGRVGATFRALSGIAMPGQDQDNTSQRPDKLRHGTSLADEVHGVERLSNYLADTLGAPVVVQEFIGVWTDIPNALQSRLGQSYAQLGADTVVGKRSFGRQDRAELRVGPLSISQFRELFSDEDAIARLRHAIIFAVGLQTEYDLRLVLDKTEVPDACLGQCQLGRTTWLNPDKKTDVDDLRLFRITAPVEARDNMEAVA